MAPIPVPIGRDTAVAALPSILPLVKRQVNSNATGADMTQTLGGQWANPADVSTILMVIGGDVVQKALAQSTGV